MKVEEQAIVRFEVVNSLAETLILIYKELEGHPLIKDSPQLSGIPLLLRALIYQNSSNPLFVKPPYIPIKYHLSQALFNSLLMGPFLSNYSLDTHPFFKDFN